MADEDPEFLTPQQASDISGISKSVLAKLRVYGGGPPYLQPTRNVIYVKSEFLRWMMASRRRTTADEGLLPDATAAE